jgi:hypothetical protein
MKSRLTFLLAAAIFVATTAAASACPACYGDTTGDKMGKAAQVGIFAMVAIMFVMLSAVGAFIWHLARRAKNPLPDYDELLRDDSASSGGRPLSPHPQPEST